MTTILSTALRYFFCSLTCCIAFRSSVAANDESLSRLEQAAIRWLPPGKALKVNSAYSSEEARGGSEKPIVQTCQDVECHFSGDDAKRFWVNFSDFESTWINGKAPTQISSRSIYSDGTTVQDMTRWGRSIPGRTPPTSAELFSIGSRRNIFSPYVSGLAFTLPHLILAPESGLRKLLVGAKPGTISYVETSLGLEVRLNQTFESGAGSAMHEVFLLVSPATLASPLRLKSLRHRQLLKGFGPTTDTVEQTEVSSWIALSSELSFPKDATFTRTINDTVHFKAVYTCRSAVLTEGHKFPSAPALPANTDLVDQRSGIKMRTGDAPAVLSSKVQEYLEKALKEDGK